MLSQEYLDDFVVEAEEHLGEIEPNLIRLEREPTNTAIVDELFRSFHSIKGLANYIGLAGMGDLSHQIESLLELVRQNRIAVSADLISLLFKATDRLSKLIGEIRNYREEKSSTSEITGLIKEVTSPKVDAPALPSGSPRVTADPDRVPETADLETGSKALTAAIFRLLRGMEASGITLESAKSLLDTTSELIKLTKDISREDLLSALKDLFSYIKFMSADLHDVAELEIEEIRRLTCAVRDTLPEELRILLPETEAGQLDQTLPDSSQTEHPKEAIETQRETLEKTFIHQTAGPLESISRMLRQIETEGAEPESIQTIIEAATALIDLAKQAGREELGSAFKDLLSYANFMAEDVREVTRLEIEDLEQLFIDVRLSLPEELNEFLDSFHMGPRPVPTAPDLTEQPPSEAESEPTQVAEPGLASDDVEWPDWGEAESAEKEESDQIAPSEKVAHRAPEPLPVEAVISAVKEHLELLKDKLHARPGEIEEETVADCLASLDPLLSLAHESDQVQLVPILTSWKADLGAFQALTVKSSDVFGDLLNGYFNRIIHVLPQVAFVLEDEVFDHGALESEAEDAFIEEPLYQEETVAVSDRDAGILTLPIDEEDIRLVEEFDQEEPLEELTSPPEVRVTDQSELELPEEISAPRAEPPEAILEDDYDPELFGIFLNSAREHLGGIKEKFLLLRQGAGEDSIREECLATAAKLITSAKYMDYVRLLSFLESWAADLETCQDFSAAPGSASTDLLQRLFEGIVRFLPQLEGDFPLEEFYVPLPAEQLKPSLVFPEHQEQVEAAPRTGLSEIAEGEIEEDYDPELFGIFFDATREQLELIKENLLLFKQGVVGAEALGECAEAVDKMLTSSNYMGYDQMAGILESWKKELAPYADSASASKFDPTGMFVDYFRQIFGALPQLRPVFSIDEVLAPEASDALETEIFTT
ncbi:MAG: Hpt domain-containing protein [Deltaproteobacteria bacterium]|nr:Hpt domain-containing protein [Deltaproteobacteria bacterium]